MNNGSFAHFHDNSIYGRDAFLTRELGPDSVLDIVIAHTDIFNKKTLEDYAQANKLVVKKLTKNEIGSVDDLTSLLFEVDHELKEATNGNASIYIAAMLKVGNQVDVVLSGYMGYYHIRDGKVIETIKERNYTKPLGYGNFMYTRNRDTAKSLQLGDKLVLATAGVISNIRAEEIAKIVATEDTPEKAIASLENLLGQRRESDKNAGDYAFLKHFISADSTIIIRYLPTSENGSRYDKMTPEEIFQEGVRLRLEVGDKVSAIAAFESYLELNLNDERGQNVHAYANIGAAYRDLGQRSKAIESFQRALEIKPDHEFSRTERDKIIDQSYQEAHQLRLSGKREEIIRSLAGFKRVLKWNPSHLHSYADMGAAYRDLGERDKAIEYFRKALEVNPNHQFSWQNLSRLEDITNLDYWQRIRTFADPDLPKDRFQPEVPVYALSSTVLKEAFRYLITDNPKEGGRLERLVYFFGSKDSSEVRKIQGLAYPQLADQHAAHVSAEQTDSNRILIALDEKGLAWYSMAHNHNWVMFNETGNSTGAVSPSPDDVQTHERLEQAYKPFLTVIFSPDGYVGFWQPRGFEVFVDGKKLPSQNIPNLMEHVMVYKLN